MCVTRERIAEALDIVEALIDRRRSATALVRCRMLLQLALADFFAEVDDVAELADGPGREPFPAEDAYLALRPEDCCSGPPLPPAA
jgi:hypothetical protein